MNPNLADDRHGPELTNLLADVPANLPAEQVLSILARPGLRIERIVSHGHASPAGFWYDQAEAEFVVVLRGAARLRFADEEQVVELRPGACLDIAPRRRHRVEWTTPDEPTVWLAIFYKG